MVPGVSGQLRGALRGSVVPQAAALDHGSDAAAAVPDVASDTPAHVGPVAGPDAPPDTANAAADRPDATADDTTADPGPGAGPDDKPADAKPDVAPGDAAANTADALTDTGATGAPLQCEPGEHLRVPGGQVLHGPVLPRQPGRRLQRRRKGPGVPVVWHRQSGHPRVPFRAFAGVLQVRQGCAARRQTHAR